MSLSHRLLSLAPALGCLLCASVAEAQLEPLTQGISIGQWELRPSVELRLRGEYRRNPVDVGGDVYERTAVQADAYRAAAPPLLRRVPAVYDEWLISERARLGLTVRFGKVSAVVSLQDARVLGVLPGAAEQVERPGMGSFEPHLAYLQVRSDEDDPLFEMRLGRQTIHWGDGRLVGANDWQPRGGALDAARAMFHLGDGLVDIDMFAAMLVMPGPVPPRNVAHGTQTALSSDGEPVNVEGTGAQLYGTQLRWNIIDLLKLDITGVARIAREPLPAELALSDTYTVDLRIHGDHRGVSYAAEGAYQMGRVAGYGINRDIAAFAAAGRFGWLTALPWNLRFGAFGGYASGDDSDGTGSELKRFDPIAPDVHAQHGMMDLYAWSNMFEAGGEIGAQPHEDLKMAVTYAYVGLAEPNDRWSTGTLTAVGAAAENDAAGLGHEVDVRFDYQPFDGVGFGAGYGLFLLGSGGSAILEAAGRGSPDLLHYGYLQAQLKMP